MEENKLLKLNFNTKEYVRKLYGLDTSRIDQGVDILEQWIKKQPYFVKKDYDKIYLEMALINTKGSIEMAKEKMEKLCVLKTLLPQYFALTNFRDDFNNLLQNQCAGVITPNLTAEHYRVILYKFYNNDYFQSLTSFLDIYRHFLITYEYLKVHDYCAGYVFVYDFRDINISSILSRLNLVEFKNVVTILMKTQGMKIKNLIYLSESKAIDSVVKLIKPFLSPKIANRIVVCKDLEEVHQIVPKDVLPVEFGGTERSYKEIQEDWTKVLSEEKTVEYLLDMQRAGVTDSYKKLEVLSDMAGSFVTLEFD